MKQLSCALEIAMALSAVGASVPVTKSQPTTGADLSSLRDITGIETLPPVPPAPRWPYVVGTAIVCIAGLGVVGWKLSRRHGAAVAMPPDRWALQELDRVEAIRLP